MAADALAEPTVTVSTTDGHMKYTLYGGDIDPTEQSTPGLLDARRKQSSFMAGNRGPASAAISQWSTPGPSPNLGKCSFECRTQGALLPATDAKIFLRPRGILVLATVPVAILSDNIQQQAALPLFPENRVRIHLVSNFIVVNTSS